MIRGGAAALAAAGGLAGLGYYLLVTGKLTAGTDRGRRIRPHGPLGVEVTALADTVSDVIAAPYLGWTPRAMVGKLFAAAGRWWAAWSRSRGSPILLHLHPDRGRTPRTPRHIRPLTPQLPRPAAAE